MRWNIFDDSRLAFNGSNGAISTFGEEIRDTGADKTPKLSTIDKNAFLILKTNRCHTYLCLNSEFVKRSTVSFEDKAEGCTKEICPNQLPRVETLDLVMNGKFKLRRDIQAAVAPS